jgi:arabinoxylan arabinofuranohydrolase
MNEKLKCFVTSTFLFILIIGFNPLYAKKKPVKNITNPLISELGMSDPHMLVVDDVCYVFTGLDVGFGVKEWVMPEWRIYRSEDLIKWQHVGTIKPEDNYMGKGNTECWACDIVKRNGKYYFYFSDRSRSFGVMVADKPEGPYVDALGKPLVNSFDPHIFIDDDRKPYVLWGSTKYGIARLKNSMIELDEEPRKIVNNRKDTFPAMDKVTLHKYKGTYYLGCSGYYSTSKNVYGPYEYKGLLGESYGLNTPFAHGDYFVWKGNWYFVWCKYRDRKVDKVRDCYIAPVIYNKDGSMRADLSVMTK